MPNSDCEPQVEVVVAFIIMTNTGFLLPARFELCRQPDFVRHFQEVVERARENFRVVVLLEFALDVVHGERVARRAEMISRQGAILLLRQRRTELSGDVVDDTRRVQIRGRMTGAAIFSLSCGAIIDLGICRYAGKEQGELSVFRTLWDFFRPGDVVLTDRLMCT